MQASRCNKHCLKYKKKKKNQKKKKGHLFQTQESTKNNIISNKNVRLKINPLILIDTLNFAIFIGEDCY